MKLIHNEESPAISGNEKYAIQIERFYPQLWRSVNPLHTGHPVKSIEQLVVLSYYREPYKNALHIDRVPVEKSHKIPTAIPEPIIPLHDNPPE